MAMSAKEDQVDQTCLSLFTSNHDSHDSIWMTRGSAFNILCIACLIEALEDKDVLAIRKRKILSEILVLVSRDDKMAAVLTTNLKVCSHLCGILVNLLEVDNEAVCEMAIEGLVQLACKLRSEIIVREIVDNAEKKISGINNLRKSCTFITLIGKLVNMIAPLSEEIAVRKSNLLEYCISNLLFPEEKSRLSLMYLVLGICQNNNTKSKLSIEKRNVIFKSVCESLADAKSRVVIMNSLALLQTFTNAEDVKALGLLAEDKDGQDKRGFLGKALKKVILDTDENIQIGGIQCTTKFLSFDLKEGILSRGLLQCGLAEFLFEGLETNNDVVLASLFCCLSGFCNSTDFFKGSYSVYGIDSVVSGMYKALKLQNPETIHQGLHVLSTIINKQPRGVSLFSNGATFERCLSAIQECFNSMEYKVLQEGINVVGSLLRVDQLPSGFNIKGMLPSLSAVISLIKTFTTKNVDTFSGMKTDTAQQLLCSSLAVTHKAITFVSEYQDKSPSLEEVLLEDDPTYSHQSTRERSIKEVKNFLMRAVDEFCIAAVMMNFEAITNPMVFEVLFCLINSQLSSPNDPHSQLFAKKLSSASFIRVSIDINGKFCKGGPQKSLKDALHQFQRKLILCLTDVSEKEQMDGILESAFIPASPDECLTLLSQSSIDPISNSISDKMLFKIQCFCIELLYFAYIHQDSILPEQLLLRGLHKYICVHRNLGLLPLITLRHLVFLYASITVKLKAVLPPREFISLTESHRILEGTLLKLQADEFLKVTSQDARFVLWVFSSEALGKTFGCLTLENLLSGNDDGGQEQRQAMLWDALKDNETALRSLLSLAFCENTHVVKKALDIIEKVLQHASQEEPNFIVQVTTEELQKLFLRNQVSPLPEPILLSMLKILLPLQAATGSQVEIKLLCFVIDILTKPTNKVPSIMVAAINYLNVALSVNMDSQHPRVASVLFSNADFISWLQKAMTSLSFQDPRKSNGDFVNAFAACILLVSNLVLSESKLRIDHSVKLKLEKDVLIELLNDCQSCLFRLVCLVFWKAYFGAGGRTLVLFEDSTKGKEANPDNTLTELDLQVIYIYLQNSLMHESEAVKGCSMECMRAFMFFEGCKDICKANKWNSVIIESLLFSTGNEELNPHLVQLCTMMLKLSDFDHEKDGVLSKAVQTIQHRIPKTHLDLNDTEQSKVAFRCIEFLNQVQVINRPEFASSDELLTWCRNLQDLLRKIRKRKFVEFISVDQVVFTKASLMGQVAKDALAKVTGKVIRRMENKLPNADFTSN